MSKQKSTMHIPFDHGRFISIFKALLARKLYVYHLQTWINPLSLHLMIMLELASWSALLLTCHLTVQPGSKPR